MALANSRQITQEEITQMEQELSKMEYDLNEQYCELGKVLLEKTEQEGKKINALVDQIIALRQRLSEIKNEEEQNGTE